MTFFVAHGWGVKMGGVPARGGRLVAFGADWTTSNRWPSYPGFDGYTSGGTEFQADSVRTLGAIVKWLTGKTSGANCLILTDNVGVEYNHVYGLEFQAALTALGHTFVLTGSLSSWAGYEPLDYDCTFMGATLGAFSYHGLGTAQEKVDYVLSNDGAMCGAISNAANVWAVYGFPYNGAHADGFLGTDHSYQIHRLVQGPYSGANDGWADQIPFACDAFGDPGAGGSWGTHYYALVCPSTTNDIGEGANSRGGTSTLYHCAVPEDKNAFEDHYYDHQAGAIGLWTDV